MTHPQVRDAVEAEDDEAGGRLGVEGSGNAVEAVVAAAGDEEERVALLVGVGESEAGASVESLMLDEDASCIGRAARAAR